MAYKLNDQKITPGGLNLLAPGDQVAEGDCLDLTGWWSAAAGRLEQAPEAVSISAGGVPVVPNSDSLLQADGRIYYGASGAGTLRQIGRMGEAPIDTGYDANPLGMLSYQGYAWIMNRAQQRKDDGTTTSDWTPAAPAAPTLTDLGHSGVGASPPVGNPPNIGGLQNVAYNYYTTWQLGTLGETNPSSIAMPVTAATNATPIVVSTSIAHMLANAQSVTISGVGGNTAANVTAYAKTAGYTATTFGLYSDAALTVAIAGSGAYTSGGIVTTVQTVTPARLIVSGASSATPIRITTTTNHGLADNDAVTVSQVGGNTAANVGCYVHVISPTTFDMYSDTPYTTPIAWSAGAYTSGGVVTTAGSIVRITCDPSPPANATGWNIYRQSPTLSAPYRLNEGTIDLTRTYVDDYGDDVHTHSDTNLLDLGIIMEADHDRAPACKVIANQIYNGRIVVANSAAFPNRVWYTPALQPAFFRGSGNPNDGDWVDIGTDKGDEILAMTVRPGMVVVYRSRSIWRHVGDFGNPGAYIQCVVPEIGAVGVRAAVQTSLGDYFVGADGVYKFNGEWAQKISAKVEPIFLGKPTENLPTQDTTQRAQCAIGYHNGRLWVSYGGFTGSLIHHVESQRWFSAGSSYKAYLDTGSQFLGSGFGVFSLENSYPANAALSFQSEYQDCGVPDHEKTWADLVLHHNTQGNTLTITARINKQGNVGEIPLGTITSTTLTKQVIPLVGVTARSIRSYNLAIRVWAYNPLAAGTAPIVIESPLLLHYYVEARKANMFDTSLTDHGATGVKTVDQVELDIDCSAGDAVLYVSSDIPGGTMAPRLGEFGQEVVKSAGRECRRLVLPASADGRLLRYQVVPFGNASFQLYGMRARVLPIGVYLDGTVGDFWQPQPIGIGV